MSYGITTIPTNEEMRRALFKSVMEGKWEDVMSLCSRHCWLCGERITKLGNTALHFAVYESKERVVRRLVRIIERWLSADEAVTVLSTRNTEGNTPLHLAVLGGNFEMCRCICDGRPELLGERNNEGETPLFLAARVGEMDAFTWLLCRDTQNSYVNSRNIKGDTVLHSAISGEHWKLALLVLQRFGHLSICRNEEGMAPLHLLAEKPGAFKSGTYLSLFDKFIYHLIPSFARDYKDKTSPRTTESTGNQSPPESDASNALPQYMIDMVERGFDSAGAGEESNIGRSSIPPHCDTCVPFISLVNSAVRPYVEIWITWLKRQNYVQKINKKKETNLLALRIMNRLLEIQEVETYEFEKAGWNRKFNEAASPFAEEKEERSDLPSRSPVALNTPEKTPEENEPFEPYEASRDAVLLSGVGRGAAAGVVTNARETAEYLDYKFRKTAQKKDGVENRQTAILLAAKNGINEMVKNILEINPTAIQDADRNKKNAALLAVENRQPTVYEFLLKKYGKESNLFRAVDKEGCSALHLAAMFSDNQSRFIPGAALQMQCEVLWFEYVKNSMRPTSSPSHNYNNKIAEKMFADHHKELMKEAKEWLKDTSNSCSLVATIIATVAFATSSSVPGGTSDETGKPYLEHHLPFRIFAVSSLVALCFSVTSIVMFLAILTSRHLETDFGRNLPRKLLLGLTALFISILAMLVNFCSSHFFVLQDELKMAALPVYAVTCLPATYFAVAQLPLYIDLFSANFSKVPQRWMKKDF